MKAFLKLLSGTLLVTFSLFALSAGVFQILPTLPVDFPCKDRLEVKNIENPRIGYCLDLHSPSLAKGGSLAESGASTDNIIMIEHLTLRRDHQFLLIENKSFPPGEGYQTTRWIPYKNPWLIYSYRYVMKNEGILSISSSESSGMLYVYGNTYVSWYPSPFGLVIIGVGVWLFMMGLKEQEKNASAKTQAG